MLADLSNVAAYYDDEPLALRLTIATNAERDRPIPWTIDLGTRDARLLCGGSIVFEVPPGVAVVGAVDGIILEPPVFDAQDEQHLAGMLEIDPAFAFDEVDVCVRVLHGRTIRASTTRTVALASIAHTPIVLAAGSDELQLRADVDKVRPGETIVWNARWNVAEPTEDLHVEIAALGGDLDDASLRVLYEGTAIVVPTTRRGTMLCARIAALCARDGVDLVFSSVVPSPQVCGGSIAVDVSIASGQSSARANASIAVQSAPLLAHAADAIMVREPLRAGSSARFQIAVVNIGTAIVHGVRVTGSLEGVDGALVRIAKETRDDVVPMHTEFLDGRIVLPSPIANGTIVTVCAKVQANGCEPVAIRRSFRVSSGATFVEPANKLTIDGEVALRPKTNRTASLVLANAGTDAARGARLRLAAPPWLRFADVEEGGNEVALGTVECGARLERMLSFGVSADAPRGKFSFGATVLWDDGESELAVIAGFVETMPAFDTAVVEIANPGPYQPDDLIEYRFSVTNTGDGSCEQLHVRATSAGPATYHRASLKVNGVRFRDWSSAGQLFGEGLTIADIPVGASVRIAWAACVDADVAQASEVVTSIDLKWERGGDHTVTSSVAAVEPSESNAPLCAFTLPPCVPAVETAEAPQESAFGSSTCASLLRYLERSAVATGTTALLDVRIFLPLPNSSDRDSSVTDRAFVEAIVRGLDRFSIAVYLEQNLATSLVAVGDDLRKAFTLIEPMRPDASLASILHVVLHSYALMPRDGILATAFAEHRISLLALFALWDDRASEIEDLAAARLPDSIVASRESLVAALAACAR